MINLRNILREIEIANSLSTGIAQQKPRMFHASDFMLVYNVGSYTQGRIAGGFLSSRKTARAERCPPETTAAALDG